jgi:hypothetical protein
MSNVAAKLNDYWNEKRGGTEKRITFAKNELYFLFMYLD